MGCGCGCSGSFVTAWSSLQGEHSLFFPCTLKGKKISLTEGLRWLQKAGFCSVRIVLAFGHMNKLCTRGLGSVFVLSRPLLLFPPLVQTSVTFPKVDQPLHLTWCSAHYSPLSCLALNRSFFAGTLIYSLNRTHLRTMLQMHVQHNFLSFDLLSIQLKSSQFHKRILCNLQRS